MTIFDVIKYPISDCPTKEELEALPVAVYAKWLLVVGTSGRLTPDIVSIFYSDFCEYTQGKRDIMILRKIIKEYEPV